MQTFRFVLCSALLFGVSVPAGVGAQTFYSPEGAAPGALLDSPVELGYGAAVAVGDGEVFVGEAENFTRPGRVYVYRRGGMGWTEAGFIEAPDATRKDGFGAALAVSGNTLLVTASSESGGDRVYAFTKGADGNWSASGTLAAPDDAGPNFGISLAVAGDAALIGAPGDGSGQGAVYVFRNTGGSWTQAARLTGSNGGSQDLFGFAIAADGDRALVGAPGQGQGQGGLYVFTRDASGGWTEESQIGGGRRGQLPPATGFAVALAAERAYATSPGVGGFGMVATFEYASGGGRGSGWRLSGLLLPFEAGGGEFGRSIAEVGDDLWVGAGNGGIFVYERGEDGWASSSRLSLPDTRVPGVFSARAGVVAAASSGRGGGSAVILEGSMGSWSVGGEFEGEEEVIARVEGSEVECSGGEAAIFDCGQVDLLSFVPTEEIGGAENINVNDVWGWTDPESGREYAIVGRTDGTAFLDITDPVNPVYLGNLAKTEGTPNSTWRDMKVYRNHVFIVADGAEEHGVQIFDLTQLRDVQNAPVEFEETAHYDGVASSHNIVINEETGFAYAVGVRGGGETCGGGLHMIDIRDPVNPTFAGCFSDPQTGRANTGYSHDAQCIVYRGPDTEHQGKEICFGANETALSIADVTDKENPVALSRISYPNVGYAHQGWITEDHRYFYLGDELDELNVEPGTFEGTRTLVWDITDLDDPQLAKEFFGTTNASDHNLYIVGDRMYQSNYQAGLRVLDVSDPANPVEIGYFDTVPYGRNEPSMGGSWSNYPFFQSGTILVTSGREGIFLVRKGRPIS